MNAARVEGMKELHEIVNVHGASSTLAEAAAGQDLFNSALDAEVGWHGLALQGPVHLHKAGVVTDTKQMDKCCGSGSGIGCLFDPWIRDPGSEKVSGIRDEQPGSNCLELRNQFFAFLGVKILKYFDEDPGSGMETVRIRDGKKPDPG